MSNIQITFLLFIIIYLIVLLYFFKVKRKPEIIKQTTIENKANVNVFSPDENKIQKLTVNLIYDEKKEIDVTQYCDLVLSVKDLINNNYACIPNNMFEVKNKTLEEQKNNLKKETLQKKKENINFNKIYNINSIIN